MDQGKLRRLLRPEKLIWLLLLVLLAERLVLFWQFGVRYMSKSDDIAYLESGLLFAKTGMISMWGPYPSAMIMPGMPFVIGAFSLLFGEGDTLLLALKLLWILMGVANAFVAYRTASLAAGGWAGFFAACGFLVPNMAWMNHVLLTETPYMLFFSLCLYLTLRLERGGGRGCRIAYVLSFMAARLFRANILLMLLFTSLWLLIRRQGKPLLRLLVPLLAALLLFTVPWSIRNYRCFDAFIPFSYGAGNPLLLGTYQGEGYPEDDALDYESNVHAVMRERYAAYYKEPEPQETDDYYITHFDPNGEVRDLRYAQYLSLEADGVMAKYRLREWWKQNPLSLLKSYLFIKPRWMLNWSWAWMPAFHVPYETLHRISQLNFLVCGMAVILALVRKRCRAPLLFLCAVYWISIYFHALAFVTDRYASTYTSLRYTVAGIGIALALEWIGRRRARKSADTP